MLDSRKAGCLLHRRGERGRSLASGAKNAFQFGNRIPVPMHRESLCGQVAKRAIW